MPHNKTSMQALEIIPVDGKKGRLRLATLPIPHPAPNEVLIRVHYIGVNRADVMQRDGMYPPPEGASHLPGLEISGTIVALGMGIQVFALGQEVCALLAGGGYAEYVAVPAGQVLPLPSGMSLQHAAALPEACATSVMALCVEAQLQPGERVLMHGGTSGLGIILIQIAKALGAEVFTTVGSDEKVQFLQRFGVTALNHRTQPFAEQVMQHTQNQGVDVIVDTLGGPQVNAHFSLLRRGGRMVSLAMMEGVMVESLKMVRVLTHHLKWSGATLRSRSVQEKSDIIKQVQLLVWPHVESGQILSVIDKVFPFAEAEKAFAHMQERLHLGKILLEVTPN